MSAIIGLGAGASALNSNSCDVTEGQHCALLQQAQSNDEP